MDFTACTVLSTQNITAREANPFPPVMKGRVRHMVNPLSIGKTFPVNSFDELIFFLPGLSFSVPKELGTADRPLFAYRVHHFVFQLLRSAKCLLKEKVNCMWCGQRKPVSWALLVVQQALKWCNCWIIWAANQRLPSIAWKTSRRNALSLLFLVAFTTLNCQNGYKVYRSPSFQIDMKPISLPLSVALQLHPDLELVSIKGAVTVAGMEAPAETAPLRQKLIYEAIARKARLKEIFSRDPKETSNYDLVKEALAPDPEAWMSCILDMGQVFPKKLGENPQNGWWK